MDKDEVWLKCFTAALSGVLAAEREGFRFTDRAQASKVASLHADFGCGEFVKRFGPFQKEER